MDLFKTPRAQAKASTSSPLRSKSDALRLKRQAHEDAQKAAGTWGDMSVGTVRRDNGIFVYLLKGGVRISLSDLALKKPKDMPDADHEAFLRWLKIGQFDGFVQGFAAWNVSAEEAARVKSALLVKHRDEGLTVINQVAPIESVPSI